MKNLHKISFLLAILATSKSFYMIARSGGVGSPRGAGETEHNTSHGGVSNRSNGTALVGGAGFDKTREHNNKQDAAHIEAPHIVSPVDQLSQNNIPDSSEIPTAQPINQNATQEPQNIPAPILNTDLPVKIVNNGDQAQNSANNQNTLQKNQEDDTKNNQAANSKDINTAHEDQKTIVPDKDEILRKLEIIDLQDHTTQMLLSNDSMNQIFNNFIYFKNFIVNNFSKDKMLRLSVEFINQLYPQENIQAITIGKKSENKKADTDDKSKQPNEENAVAQDNNPVNLSSAATTDQHEDQSDHDATTHNSDESSNE